MRLRAVCLILALGIQLCNAGFRPPVVCDEEDIEDSPGSCVRVAVIGTGAGGASFAQFLRQAFNATGPRAQSVQISMFEQRSYTGGRIRPYFRDGTVLEAGASIFIESNRYMRDFARAAGLKVGPPSSSDARMGIWNGDDETFAFETSSWKPLTLAKLLARYGTDFFALKTVIGNAVQRFEQSYALQDAGRYFEDVETWLKELDLFQHVQRNFSEVLPPNLRNSTLVRELVNGVCRNNYNQRWSSMNALAGCIGLAPFASGSPVLAVDSGNHRVIQHMIDSAATQVHFQQRVEKIEKASNGTLIVHSRYAPSKHSATEIPPTARAEAFDIVVVATPLETTDIEFVGFGVPADSEGKHRLGPDRIPPREFVVVHTTFVQGELDPTYWGQSSQGAVPGNILFADGANALDLGSIGLYGHYDDGTAMYKFFSTEELNDWTIKNALFKRVTQIRKKVWHAYPRFNPPEVFAPTRVAGKDEQVFYINAVESAGSAMEISMVWGRNIAMLVAEEIRKMAPAARMKASSSKPSQESKNEL